MKVLAGLFCLFMALEGTASPWSVEVGLGYSKHEKPTNGLWYQKPFPYEINDESPSFSIGLKYKRLSLGYKFLGRWDSDAMASASDENYANWRAGKEEIWKLSRFKGHGHAHGIYLNYEQPVWHGLYVNGGMWYQEVKWQMDVDYYNPRWGKVIPLTVYDDHQELTWHAGIGYRWGKIAVSYEIWDVQGGSPFPPTFGGKAQNINIKYAF